jgi:phosphoribosyl-AMP cyclohydrolase / phosphoribosyl-ATP pyrophosphohydrolase
VGQCPAAARSANCRSIAASAYRQRILATSSRSPNRLSRKRDLYALWPVAGVLLKIPLLDAKIAFDENGLVPCIVQDARTGEVLTLAYMNEEALARTRETGETHFWSRSREELWHKGETSGNVQKVLRLRYDCDADALLALVSPAGPACHTGERTCFYRGDMEPTDAEALATLERTVAERSASTPVGSYTVELLSDPPRVGEKVREEAEEVARAADSESAERVREEAADLLYHLTVLLASRGLSLADAFEELNARRR